MDESLELGEHDERSLDADLLDIDVYQREFEASEGYLLDDSFDDFYRPEELLEEPTLKILASSYFQAFNPPPECDRGCLICTDEMPNAEEIPVDEKETVKDSTSLDLFAVDRPIKTVCNHVVGARCLWRWMFDEKQYTCPCCRQALFEPLRETAWHAPLVVDLRKAI